MGRIRPRPDHPRIERPPDEASEAQIQKMAERLKQRAEEAKARQDRLRIDAGVNPAAVVDGESLRSVKETPSAGGGDVDAGSPACATSSARSAPNQAGPVSSDTDLKAPTSRGSSLNSLGMKGPLSSTGGIPHPDRALSWKKEDDWTIVSTCGVYRVRKKVVAASGAHVDAQIQFESFRITSTWDFSLGFSEDPVSARHICQSHLEQVQMEPA